MRPIPSAIELVATARQLQRRASSSAPSVWRRAAALLCRQALEAMLAHHARAARPGLETLPVRIQLICLGELSGQKGLVLRMRQLWSALSEACHHHPYEVAPGAGDVEEWLTALEETTRLLQGEGGSSARF